MSKLVSVIIPSYNEDSYIELCVRSVFNSTLSQDFIEVIVCDGGSTDQTLAILERLKSEFKELKVLQNPYQTTPYALNMGITQASAPQIMILGAHSKIAPNYLEKCLQILSEKPEISCVGGVLKNIPVTEDSAAIAAAMSSAFGVGNAYFRTGNYSGVADTVAFGVYRKEIFDKVGLFDTDLVRNQDDEFNYRLQKNGMLIWLTSETYVEYYVRSGFDKLYQQYFQYGYWKVYVNQKHRIITTLRQLAPPIFVLGLWLGIFLCLFFPILIPYYLLGLIFYFSVATLAAYNTHFPKLLKVMKAFFYLHYAYGAGYLNGIVHFILLKKKPIAKSKQISR